MTDAFDASFDHSLIKIGPIDVDIYPTPYAHNYAAPQPYPSNAYPSFQESLYGSEAACLIEPLDIARRVPAAEPRRKYVDPTTSPRMPVRPDDSENEEDEIEEVDTSKMTKEQLRKHKNRQSAARSRKRSRSRMEELELTVQKLSAKNRRLEDQVQALLAERNFAIQRQQQQMHHMHPSYY